MTDYRSLLVHYDAGRTAPQRLEYAIHLARQFDAHVACLYALDMMPAPSSGYEGRAAVIEAQKRAHAEMLADARRSYEETLRRTGYEKVEWRDTSVDALAAVALHARYADLVVVGQQNDEWPSGVGKELERAIPLAAGRPVLLVPYAFQAKEQARRVLIAWNASREAGRAVSDALPILRKASQVHVVTVNAKSSREGHGEEPGADIGLFLTRHGVKVTVSRQDATDLDIGNLLLSRAFDLQADLIVSGAWGHSRLREMVLGGVTRTLLESMTVPVLVAH